MTTYDLTYVKFITVEELSYIKESLYEKGSTDSILSMVYDKYCWNYSERDKQLISDLLILTEDFESKSTIITTFANKCTHNLNTSWDEDEGMIFIKTDSIKYVTGSCFSSFAPEWNTKPKLSFLEYIELRLNKKGLSLMKNPLTLKDVPKKIEDLIKCFNNV